MAALCAVWLVATLGAGFASAQPAQPVPSGALPQGFPSDLRRFVDGTEEFRSGRWFTGACADRGGDVGAYINEVMAVEDRLIYWAATPEKREELVGGEIEPGSEPPAQSLPRVFPAGDTAFALPSACADDLKQWTQPAENAWGFTWAATPDQTSLQAMRRSVGVEDFASVPFAAWTDPCAEHGMYCNHAFFVECNRADLPPDDQQRCLDWNRAVGRLFVGTAKWIDLNTTLGDRLRESVFGDVVAAGAAVVEAFAWLWDVAVATVRFIDDPQSVIDDWANSSKDSAVDLTVRVLDGLSATGRFDPGAGWFQRWYALSAGIGVMVMGLMTLLALWRAAAKGQTVKTIAGDLFAYLPVGLVLMLFAPMLATWLLDAANAATDAIVAASGPEQGVMVNNLQEFTSDLTDKTLAGGVLVGLLLFLLLIVAVLSVFFGLLVHQVALPCLAIAAGIGFGMWVHPQWRRKALRPVLVFLAVVISKPLLFLLLATLSGLMNAALTNTAGQEQLSTLSQLCLVIVAFLVVGLAPWSLLKYAPLLPSRADAAGFGQSGSLMAGAVSGAGSAMAWRGSSGRGLGHAGATAGRSSGSDGGGESRTSTSDPGWRTAGSGDGRSATESQLGNRLAANTNTTTSTNTAAAGRNGRAEGGNRGARTLKTIAQGGKAAVGTTAKAALAGGMIAAPIAAQAAGGALNKARSVAESAPGEAETEPEAK
ncbi:hypothetical protein AB0H76_09760 [Nocardia sp. NPDC050712]|uniref:hypothetical protein n=1 Tax=Nocardia sp. NPDC050712 TaxID=3155518 RepID=UPI00340D2C4D